MNKVTKDALDKTRAALKEFREKREKGKMIGEEVKKEQPLLIATMQELGFDNETGLVIDPTDKNKGTAYVQQNSGSTVWNHEKIMDWLNKPVKGRSALKRKSQSLVFDINKFDALVASGEIPAKVANKFKEETAPPAPFIRFGKESDTSK